MEFILAMVAILACEYVLFVPSCKKLSVLFSVDKLVINSENVMVAVKLINHPRSEIFSGAYLIVFD